MPPRKLLDHHIFDQQCMNRRRLRYGALYTLRRNGWTLILFKLSRRPAQPAGPL